MVTDDALEPEAIEWLEQYRHDFTLEDNGYVMFYGLGAAQNEDPYSYGVNQINQFKDKIKNKEQLRLQVSKGPLPLMLLDEHEDFCELHEFSCYEKLWSDNNDLTTILAEQSLLLSRYKHMLNFDYFGPVSSPSISFPLPNYSYTRVGNQLLVAEVFQFAKMGDFSSALNLLEIDRNSIRNRLGVGTDVITFVIDVVRLTENIKISSFIISKMPSDSDFSNLQYIQLLTPAESPAENGLFEREFVSTATAIMDEPQLAHYQDYPNFLIEIFYKQNITINNLYYTYREIRRRFQETFSTEYSSEPHPAFELPFNIRNIIGSMIAKTAIPLFLDLSDEYYNLNGYITLLNKLILRRKNATENSQISQKDWPLLPIIGSSVYFSQNRVCYKDPSPDSGEHSKEKMTAESKNDICIYVP